VLFRALGKLIACLVAVSGLTAQEPLQPLSVLPRQEVQATMAAFRRLPVVPCRYKLITEVFVLPMDHMGAFESLRPIINRVSSLTVDAAAEVLPQIVSDVRVAIANLGNTQAPPAVVGKLSVTRGSVICRVARSEQVVKSEVTLAPDVTQTHLRFADREVILRPDVNLVWQWPVPSMSLNTLSDLLYPMAIAPMFEPELKLEKGTVCARWRDPNYQLQLQVSPNRRSWAVTSGLVIASGTTALTLVDYTIDGSTVAPRSVVQVNLQTGSPPRCEIRLHAISEFSYSVTLADVQMIVPMSTRFEDQLNPVPLRQLPSELSKWVLIR